MGCNFVTDTVGVEPVVPESQGKFDKGLSSHMNVSAPVMHVAGTTE